MLRIRWTALGLIAALVAPWAAPCLAAAPSDAADKTMACCVRPAPNAPPTVRPCCAPGNEEPSTPGQSSGGVIHGVTASTCASFARAIVAPLIQTASLPVRSSDVRLRSTVLLI